MREAPNNNRPNLRKCLVLLAPLLCASLLQAQCGTTVYDPSGTSDYGNNVNFTITYCPDIPGELVTLTFNQFATELNYDFLTIHDGLSLSAPVIGTFSGTTIMNPIYATNPSGCLTLHFVSDAYVTGAGWAASVTCGTAPECVLVLTLQDSWGDGWGSSNVGVSINGGPFTPYSLTGYQRTIGLPLNIGDVVVLNYVATGDFQNENSYSLSIQGGGGLFFSGTEPMAGVSFTHTVDCTPPPAPPEDCVGAITVCNNIGFNNNTNNTGFVSDLSAANWGCITSGEHQGTWYVFSPSTGGNLGFSIAPSGSTDYDWAMWGPFAVGGDLGGFCPPSGPPIRCAASSRVATFSSTGSYSTGMGHATFSPPQFAGANITYSIPSTTDVCPLIAPQKCGWIPGLQVTEGQVYLLYIDNWDRSGLAFSLEWNLGNGASLDCTVLPVELLGVRAELLATSVDIIWSAAGEIDIDRYFVERSANGIDFLPIAALDAQAGSASVIHYRHSDPDPIRGTNYYRIKALENNGQFKHSNVVTALFGGGHAPVMAPNPMDGKATLSLGRALPPNTTLRILDTSGRMIRQQKLITGGDYLSLDLVGLDAGVYILTLTSEEGSDLGMLRFAKH